MPELAICVTVLAKLHSTPANRFARTVIALMTLAGWFVLSNHCALGRLSPSAPAKNAHACCQNSSAGKSAPASSPGKTGPECCKSIHALVQDGSKTAELKPALLAYFLPLLPATDMVVSSDSAVVASDTGPPEARSFSELVLHRSLRSHAPPRLA